MTMSTRTAQNEWAKFVEDSSGDAAVRVLLDGSVIGWDSIMAADGLYDTDAFVAYDGDIWISLVDDNTAEPGTDVTKWIKYTDNLTKSDVGLGNVDNTADVDKPVSTAVQTALDGKYDADVTPGTVEAGKPLVPDSNKAIDELTVNFLKYGEEYGVEFDPTDPTGGFARLGSFAPYQPGAALPESAMPDWMRPRQFIVNDAGVPQYELYKLDRRLRTTTDAGGTRQDADLTGGDGHVVTRFPAHYVKREVMGDGKIRLWWRNTPGTGYVLHPAFTTDAAKSNIYVGAYDAAGYDVSGSAYADGDGTNAWFDTAAGKLGSVSGKKPLTNFTRAQFRAAAARVDASCQLVDEYTRGMINGLFLLKYADFNSQRMVGAGNTQFDAWDFANCIAATGKSNEHGVIDAGKSTLDGNSGDYVNLFGLEDWWGNIWKFIDGININSALTYLCSNPANFADDTIINYVKTAENVLASSGQWQKALISELGIFLPKTGGAASDTYLSDYWYYSTGWRVFRAGGDAHGGARAGAFFGSADCDSAYVSSAVGGRLCWKK